MSISRPLLKMLLIELSEINTKGPLLMLGNQAMQVQYNDSVRLMYCAHLNPDFSKVDNTKCQNNFTSKDLFHLLGFDDVLSCDYSGMENPDIIFDLQDEFPDELYERFGVVLDVGTLEHVFDVHQSYTNVMNMVKTGGYIIHLTPVTAVNHGFYHFSPTFFNDLYTANGFKMESMNLIGNSDSPFGYLELNPESITLPYDLGRVGAMLSVVAKKMAPTPKPIKIPTQKFYQVFNTDSCDVIAKKKKYYIWGTRQNFYDNYEMLLENEETVKNFCGFIDNDVSIQGETLLGHTIFPPSVLEEQWADVIFIASHAIIEILCDMSGLKTLNSDLYQHTIDHINFPPISVA